MPPLLEAVNLHRTFDGHVEALRGVSLRLETGESVALQGPSGCGKTTLLHLLGGLDTPSSGDLRFHGVAFPPVASLNTFRARSVGFVFQEGHLLPTLTARENVEVPMFEMGWSAPERQRRAEALLVSTGLDSRHGHLPRALSGGERQRVAIARSLANEPAILLADEPTGHLDSATRDHVLALLQSLCRQRGVALLVATHDDSVARGADRVLRMMDGRL